MTLKHLLLAVLITAIWGINFSVIKIGLATVDPFILAGLRFTLCALPAIFFIKRPRIPWRYLISYGGIFGIGLWGVVNLGIKSGLSAGIASLVLQFSALFSLILGARVFNETLTRYQVAGMIIALLGRSCILFLTDGSVTLPGLILVLCGAVAWSIANVISKLANTTEVLGFLVWSSVFSPLPLFLLDITINGSASYATFFSQITVMSVFSILFQVYPNTLFAYWIWNSLLKKYPVSTVAPLSLLVPVFGLLSSVLIFNEAVPATKALAFIFIVLGLITGLYGQRVIRALSNKLPSS